jgi:hypothetical protein
MYDIYEIIDTGEKLVKTGNHHMYLEDFFGEGGPAVYVSSESLKHHGKMTEAQAWSV